MKNIKKNWFFFLKQKTEKLQFLKRKQIMKKTFIFIFIEKINN